MDESGFDSVFGALNASLNLRLLNQNIITSNIANADTPGYKAKVLEFESYLRDALNISHSLSQNLSHENHKNIEKSSLMNPMIYEIEDHPVAGALDGNTVDRALEMEKLAENQLLYDASTEMLRRKLGMLKYAITEGGGNR